MTLVRAGVLRRAVYHEVTSKAEKNLRECVRRIDGGDAVRGGEGGGQGPEIARLGE